jgi:hypothetical protein
LLKQNLRGRRPRKAAPPRRRRSAFEQLESRRVLSAPGAPLVHPTYVVHRHDGSATPFSTSAPTGLTPAQIRHAYGFDLIGDGAGQTIAIIDAYDDPTIASDLHNFDAYWTAHGYNLPDPPSFSKVAQDGSTNYPTPDPSSPGNNTWEIETALDVEWSHALAPGANILLVEANSTSDSDLFLHAVNYARSVPGVAVVSMSFGGGETSSETADDSIFTTPSGHTGVTFLASTGDNGAPAGYPAYSPNVVAVGGTTLSVDANGNRVPQSGDGGIGESGWSGSGGGVSTVESQPAYQNGVVTQFSSTMRTAPDVSFDADPNSGVPLFDSWDFGTSSPWLQVGGTSFSSPSWAALIAIADQARVSANMTALDGKTQTLPKLYSISAADFNDVILGNNGFAAGAGYDLVTGRGTPIAPSIVSDLVGAFAVASSTPANGSTVSTAPTDFTIALANAYDPNSVQASDLAVNGIAADSFTLTNSTTITFHYNSSPVTTQGLQTMSIAAGAITRQTDGSPVAAFSASFRYDVVRIAVTSTTPANGSTLTLPLPALTLHFNEAYASSSISASNLSLSQGSVSGFTLVDSQTVTYGLSGINSAGTLTINMAAGAVTDAFGNPGAAYSGSLLLNKGPVPFPTPLASVTPAGSLIYQNSTSGSIASGTTDTYTLPIAAGQALTILVTPSSGLQAQLNLSGTGVATSATSASAGGPAVLQTVAIGATSTYTFTVNGLSGTTGSYSIQVYLNAALSTATVGGASNHSLATAQNLDPSFVALNGTAQRGAALGTLAGSIGPDGFGYSGISIAPQFVDISGTGTAILAGTDDAFVHLRNLNGFQFKLYNTTYSSIYVSSNGLLTFGGGTSNYLNTDLTTVPSQAAIAPLWDDLIFFNSIPQSAVYWQVQGSGSSQRLIVQWNNASFYAGNYTGQVTLEAILNANGTMIFNYKNLTSGDANSDAASATVGIKDAGTQGSNRLLVSYNSSSSPFVATGKSLEIGVGLASNVTDYYAYSLAAGQTTTLAVTAQKAANVSVSLQDSQGNTLATGISPGSGSNVNSAIDNFVAPAAGTYYAVVTGTTGAPYSLVVNRDADFDTEVNGSFATAQNISGTKGVLGDILAAPATPTENWYSVNLTAGNELLLQTFTPGSANNQFVNNLAPQIQLYSPSDALIASGQGTGNPSLSQVAATTGAYRIRVLGSNSTSGEYFLSTVIDVAPPDVLGVYVSGADWNSGFLNYLNASGLGTAQLGYRLLGGSNQLAPLPWSNITTLSVVFSQDVTINAAQSGLALAGSPDLPAAPALSAATFSYDSSTHTAQWTFASPLPLDKYLLSIPSAAVTNSVGTALDGEWTNETGASPGSQFPSGDGAAGGDFNFRFNLLPGDVDQNGAVTGADGNVVRGLLLQTTASTSYSPLADLNGDGTITGLDGAVVRANLLQSLPATDPTPPNQGAMAQGATQEPAVAGQAPANGNSPSFATASAPATTANGAGSASHGTVALSAAATSAASMVNTAATSHSLPLPLSLPSLLPDARSLTPALVAGNSESASGTPLTGGVQDQVQLPSHANSVAVLSPAGTFNATKSTRSAISPPTDDLQAQLHDLVIEEFARSHSSSLWDLFSP